MFKSSFIQFTYLFIVSHLFDLLSQRNPNWKKSLNQICCSKSWRNLVAIRSPIRTLNPTQKNTFKINAFNSVRHAIASKSAKLSQIWALLYEHTAKGYLQNSVGYFKFKLTGLRFVFLIFNSCAPCPVNCGLKFDETGLWCDCNGVLDCMGSEISFSKVYSISLNIETI